MTSPTIKAVLIDLSGTLHVGDQPIPGAREALQRLRQSGRRIRFLTNTSAKSTTQLLEQLNGPNLQFDISRDDLTTSVLATATYVKKHNLKPLCLMEDVSDMPADVQDIQPKNDALRATTVPSTTSFDSVVVGLAPTQFHYSQLNMAFRILLHHSNNLIAIHRANYVRDSSSSGELSLGPGAFVAALETSSGCDTAKVMGKPSREFFSSALWDDVPVEETCMIGDDILADIQGARAVGIGTTILVQTGKYLPGDESKSTSLASHEEEEDQLKMSGSSSDVFRLCPSVVEAVDFILSTYC
ncbi:HAD-superfamily hydrolase [Nitzschia inconspicua]|uniref:Haloacid dehalogenase-like hydrolase domain-containing protein 2 n=1 Tax=Nitzschia inconspicua TaxID=303405 RepID=A0A9K3KTB0_9STRA|nr:HAD-superfamily hydrolase [Nitzschia inconspicua]